MAKRFHSKDYYSVKDLNIYTIEIWDTEFSDTSTEFEAGQDIFSLTYNGSFQNKPVYIHSSQLTFLFDVASSTHQALYTDLLSAQEGRFQIKVFRNSTFYWCGNVNIDGVNRPDLGVGNYFIEIQAIDMLGAMQNVDFNDDGTAYTGTDTLLGIIHKCLDKTGLLTFGWGASDVCIRTADNLYEDSMSTGSTNDPLALARTRHRAFFDIDSKGNYTYMSAYQVLENILITKGLNIKLSGGAFRIYAFKEMAATNLTYERRYDRDGVFISASGPFSITKTLDQDELTAAKENIVNFGGYPVLKEVKLIYKAKNWINYLAGATWTNASQPTHTANGVTIDSNSNLTTLSLVLDFNGTTTNNGYDVGQPATVPVPLYMVFRVQIKVGSYYLKRDILQIQNYAVNYGTPQWVTANSYYYVAFYFQLPPDGDTSSFGTFNINDITPNLLGSGAFEAQITFDSLRAPNTGAVVGSSFYSITWTADNGIVQIYSNGTPLTDLSDNSYSSTNDLAGLYSEKLELQSVIGDGTTPNSQGRIEVYNGSTWENSGDWQQGGAGTKYPLLSTVTRDVLALRALPANRMQGDIYDTAGTMFAHSRIDDNSSDAIWILIQGTYNARMERWSGTYFEIADSPDDLTTQTPVSIDPTPSLPTGTGGVITTPVPLPPPKTPAPTIPDLNGLIGSGSTSGTIAVGSISSINTTQTLAAGAFTAGQVITLIDPTTNFTQNFTVTQTTTAGATSIAVSGYAAQTFPPGSAIISSPQNTTVQGYGATAAASSTSSEQQSSWFDIFQQWWSVDNDLSIDWPVQMPDVGLETDENAGDGATAGLRIDGDGIQSFDSSNTTPGVKIGLAGKLELNNLATGTGTDGLIIEGGEVKKKTLPTVVTDHGALSGLADDDHTQYAKLAGRSGGQVIYGGTAAGDDITIHSTSNATKGTIILQDDVEGKGAFDFRTATLTGTGSTAGVVVSNLGVRAWNNASITPKVAIDDSGTFELRSDPNVGNGSTAGIKVNDTDGIIGYKSTSATPVFRLKTDGIVLLNHGSHPTVESDIFYVLDGVIYLDKDGTGADVHPQYGHIKTFPVFGYSTAWTVGVVNSVFFPITAEYAGLQVWKTGHGAGASQGTGAGSNVVKVYHFDGSTTTEINQLVINTGGNRTGTDSTMTNAVTLSEHDVIYFEVTQVSASTAAQGLTVDLYFKKP